MSGRNTAWLDALLAFVTRRVRPLARFPGRVVSQRADGSLEIQPDSPDVAAHDFVPLKIGVPGVKAKVPAGARVVLGFSDGDPKKPFAELVEAALPIELKVDAQNIVLNGGTAAVARVGDATSGHAHTVIFALVAPPGGGPVTGTITINTATDSIAQGAAGVKA